MSAVDIEAHELHIIVGWKKKMLHRFPFFLFPLFFSSFWEYLKVSAIDIEAHELHIVGRKKKVLRIPNSVVDSAFFEDITVSRRNTTRLDLDTGI